MDLGVRCWRVRSRLTRFPDSSAHYYAPSLSPWGVHLGTSTLDCFVVCPALYTAHPIAQ